MKPTCTGYFWTRVPGTPWVLQRVYQVEGRFMLERFSQPPMSLDAFSERDAEFGREWVGPVVITPDPGRF